MSEALPIPARIPLLHRAQRDGQGFPAGDGPGAGAGLRGVCDGGEQPAQFDRGRELAALLVDGADRGGLGLGDDEHAGRMGRLVTVGKAPSVSAVFSYGPGMAAALEFTAAMRTDAARVAPAFLPVSAGRP